MNKMFSMRFQISNIGPDWTHEHIELIDSEQKRGKRVTSLKNGQKMVVELGPFICKNDATLEKTYSLFYKEGDELVRFGHKFGFTVKGVKKSEVKKNDTIEKQRVRVQELKMLSGSKKSEEYLTMKLKSMGINLLNIEMEDELILEVIRQIS